MFARGGGNGTFVQQATIYKQKMNASPSPNSNSPKIIKMSFATAKQAINRTCRIDQMPNVLKRCDPGIIAIPATLDIKSENFTGVEDRAPIRHTAFRSMVTSNTDFSSRIQPSNVPLDLTIKTDSPQESIREESNKSTDSNLLQLASVAVQLASQAPDSSSRGWAGLDTDDSRPVVISVKSEAGQILWADTSEFSDNLSSNDSEDRDELGRVYSCLGRVDCWDSTPENSRNSSPSGARKRRARLSKQEYGNMTEEDRNRRHRELDNDRSKQYRRKRKAEQEDLNEQLREAVEEGNKLHQEKLELLGIQNILSNVCKMWNIDTSSLL